MPPNRTTPRGQPVQDHRYEESPYAPGGEIPTWVRALLSEKEQDLPVKLVWKVMLRDLDRSELDATTAAVLLWLWERMFGPKRVTAFPMQETLAADAKMSLRTVNGALRRAEWLGLIGVRRRRREWTNGSGRRGTQMSSEYYLAWPKRRPGSA